MSEPADDDTGRLADGPVLVEVTRGDAVESVHRGAFAVVDTEGRAVLAAGPIEADVFVRSAIKPLQALPLVETGAAEAYGLDNAEMALACSSHNGESGHVDEVESWLARIGCGERDLVCRGHPPHGEAARRAFFAAGETPRRVHDNCSGKHTGFLTLARQLGAATGGYNEITHPVQQRVLGVLEAMTGLDDLTRRPHGRDGCGIPALALPLGNLALAMARLGDPADQPEHRQTACTRVRRAMAAHPWLVAGTDRFCTDGMMRLAPHVLLKNGAEGVQVASLPNLGLGIAIKIADGASRAAPVVMGALLEKLQCLDIETATALAPHVRPAIADRTGRTVGEIRPCRDVL